MSLVTHSDNPRTLIFSLRNIFPRAMFRCALYEFEDILCEIDEAEIIAPRADPQTFRNQLANRLAFHGPITLRPSLKESETKREYDLFFAVCGSARDLLMVDAARSLRDACKTSVCLVGELWASQIADHRHFLRALQGFDLVATWCSQSVEALSKLTGCKCVYVPPGVDSILFCPYPAPPARVIDVLSIGRRSATTHHALLKMAEGKEIFYLHDTIAGDQCISAREHRPFYANVAKRSRYFIVNPGLIDRPGLRGAQSEIGNRYFEGAAAGTLMIGEIPTNGEFERLFDWPGSVCHLSSDSHRVDALIRELNAQPEKQERIRQSNIVHSLRRHDWAYRWDLILEHAGLKPTAKSRSRKERLNGLAESVFVAG